MEEFFNNYINDVLENIEINEERKIKHKKEIIENSLYSIINNDYIWDSIDAVIYENISNYNK